MLNSVCQRSIEFVVDTSFVEFCCSYTFPFSMDVLLILHLMWDILRKCLLYFNWIK